MIRFIIIYYYFLYLNVNFLLFFFFFSSRRRHTRYIGDWSSDVCSSDLNRMIDRGIPHNAAHLAKLYRLGEEEAAHPAPRRRPRPRTRTTSLARPSQPPQIGRASCRERV